jgi:restriction system protein
MVENHEPFNEQMHASGVPKYQNDIYWARMYLVNAGLLAPPQAAGHGIWQLTPEGWTTALDADTVAAIYFKTAKKGKKPGEPALPTDDELQQELPGTVSWELQLKKILTTMPDKGFERLCAAIMTANGLHATKVTGQSGDKGIDGEGRMAFDKAGFVSIRVAWQCKRFAEGKVGSQDVRNFRGALDHATDHGILFTTSTFTAEAVQEANQPAKKPIKLVPLDELIQTFKDLGLGVQTAADPIIDEAYFSQYLKPAADATSGSLPLKGWNAGLA